MSNLFRQLILLNFFMLLAYIGFSQNENSVKNNSKPRFSNKSINIQNRNVSEFIYEDLCGCNYKINLDIYNGIDDGVYGGNIASKKQSVGAFCVVNKNDTNGDDTLDINQKSVKNLNGKGIDEIDLMKLEIKLKGKVLPQCTDSVLLQYSGNIRFWKQKTKEQEFDISKPINIQSLSNNPLIIYIEAIDTSQHWKDIKIEAIVNNVVLDYVHATAIWVVKDTVYTGDTTRAVLPDPTKLGIDQPGLLSSLNDNLNISPNGFRSNDLTRYGFGEFGELSTLYYNNQDALFGGRILFQFKILPTDITKILKQNNITFDIGRRKNVNDSLFAHDAIDIYKEQFPLKLDISNDDPQVANQLKGDYLDEDNEPLDSTIFSFDSPYNVRSYISANYYNYLVVLRDTKFEEYVRISFMNGNNLSGDSTLRGSRCSEKIKWKINYGYYLKNSYDTLNYKFMYNYLYGSVGNKGQTVVTQPFTNYNNNFSSLININPKSNGIDMTYKIVFYTDNTIKNNPLYFKVYDAYNLNNIIAESNRSNNGPWILNMNNNLDVTIVNNQVTPIINGLIFFFRVQEFSKYIENKIKLN